MKKALCGLDISFPVEIDGVLKLASLSGFEFVCLPLVHPRYKREFIAKWKDRLGPFTRPDLVLKSCEWNTLIAGRVSPYLNVDYELLYGQAQFALEQELNYGNHLDVPAIIIPLRSSKCINLARVINSNLKKLKPYQIWIEIPMISHQSNASVWRSDINEKGPKESTWEWWNNFHILCNSDKRLGVVLEVTKILPEEKELQRWMGEPIKCLIMSTSIFLTNKKGYPVLSKSIQTFIKSIVTCDIEVIIKGNNHHFSLDCYQKYINHLWQEACVQQNSKLEVLSSDASFTQDPVQSISEILSKKYEIFEDLFSEKYQQYVKAVYQAILDQVKDDDNGTKQLNIMIVNAGKGLLVIAALEAATKCDCKVKMFALEKNPNAIVNLQAYQEEFWQDAIEIILEDIRFLKFPKIIDIVISESLATFGDNKLLPEIFNAAQKFLKRGGVLIPQSHTSYLCPVQGAKIHSDFRTTKDKSDFEIPYVMMQKYKYNISPFKPLFSFHYPNYSDSIDIPRYKNVMFKVEQKCILHGFAGFFEAVLYKEIKLSTVPDFKAPGLQSWNSIFFPLLEPVHLKFGDEIELHFWRIVEKMNVWYEWTITKPTPLPVHNAKGRFFSLTME